MKRFYWLAMLFLLGCPDPPAGPTAMVRLYPITMAPPALTASVVSTREVHTVELSPGAAIAVQCWDNCPSPTGAICQGLSVTAEDPNVEIHEASEHGGRPTFVLVGASPGSTQLELRTGCATQVYDVRVVNPPI